MSRQNVVVVGGGGAGHAVARSLSSQLDHSKFNLILVTKRDHYIHLPALLRMIVTDEGKLEQTAVIPYDHLFEKGKGQVVVGTVSEVEPNVGTPGGSVVLESGEKLSYRYLVLAVGSIWEGPLPMPDTKSEIQAVVQKWRQTFAGASEYAIVGGGAVGAELAGELRDTFPDKKITLVQGDKFLLNNTYPQKFRIDLERRLVKRNIQVITDDRIDTLPEPGSRGVTTSKGKFINADLVIPTRGPRPNTEFLKSLGSDVLTSEGVVKIRPTLQLAVQQDIFAVGDIIDFPEQKQLAKCPGHATVVAANILALINDKPLKDYKGTFEALAVTNGKAGGATYMGLLWGLTFGDWVTGMMKSKGLFVDMVRKSFGVPASA